MSLSLTPEQGGFKLFYTHNSLPVKQNYPHMTDRQVGELLFSIWQNMLSPLQRTVCCNEYLRLRNQNLDILRNLIPVPTKPDFTPVSSAAPVSSQPCSPVLTASAPPSTPEFQSCLPPPTDIPSLSLVESRAPPKIAHEHKVQKYRTMIQELRKRHANRYRELLKSFRHEIQMKPLSQH